MSRIIAHGDTKVIYQKESYRITSIHSDGHFKSVEVKIEPQAFEVEGLLEKRIKADRGLCLGGRSRVINLDEEVKLAGQKS